MAKITMQDGTVIEATIEELKEMGVNFAQANVEVPAVEIEGVQYRKVDRKPIVGDYVKISRTFDDDYDDVISKGQYYEVVGVDSDGDADILDNNGDEYSIYGDTFEVFERVITSEHAHTETKITPFNVGDYVKITDKIHGHRFNIGEIVEITAIYDPDFKAERIDGSDYWHVESTEFVRATDAEIAQAKAEVAVIEKWTAIGRKLHELKRGDIVRVDVPCGAPLKSGDIVEVKEQLVGMDSVLVTEIGWAVTVSELITPVEARFDA